MPEGIALLTIFVLSAFTGYEVISKVSTILHTPLMSSANAISGLILVGAVLIAGRAETMVELVAGLLAVTLASINLVGGFVVTDRMLDMFRVRKPAAVGASGRQAVPSTGSTGSGASAGSGGSAGGAGGAGGAETTSGSGNGGSPDASSAPEQPGPSGTEQHD